MATPTARLTPCRHPTTRSCTTSWSVAQLHSGDTPNSAGSVASSALPTTHVAIATVPSARPSAKEKWLEDRKADLLAVPYFHCVFTLPHDLNPLVLTNKRALLTLLLRATSQTLLQFGHHNLGGQLGGLLLLHTWDQTLKAHFHVHALVPGGALADQGTRWVPTQPRFLFPVHALGTVFRAKFLEALHHSRETLGFS